MPLQTSERKASTLVELGTAARRVVDGFDSEPALVCRRVAMAWTALHNAAGANARVRRAVSATNLLNKLDPCLHPCAGSAAALGIFAVSKGRASIAIGSSAPLATLQSASRVARHGASGIVPGGV